MLLLPALTTLIYLKWLGYFRSKKLCFQNRFVATLLTPELGVRRARRRFPVDASPSRRSLRPEAIGAVLEVTKWLNSRTSRIESV